MKRNVPEPSVPISRVGGTDDVDGVLVPELHLDDPSVAGIVVAAARRTVVVMSERIAHHC
jgi:hypothetical protein